MHCSTLLFFIFWIDRFVFWCIFHHLSWHVSFFWLNTDQGWLQWGERPCCECYVCHGRGADQCPKGYWPEVDCLAGDVHWVLSFKLLNDRDMMFYRLLKNDCIWAEPSYSVLFATESLMVYALHLRGYFTRTMWIPIMLCFSLLNCVFWILLLRELDLNVWIKLWGLNLSFHQLRLLFKYHCVGHLLLHWLLKLSILHTGCISDTMIWGVRLFSWS